MFNFKNSKEIQSFESQFSAETEELLALTGSNGFSGGKIPLEKYWTASIDLAAWKSPATGDIQQADGCLIVQVDDKGLKRLQNTVSGNSVIRILIRRDLDGTPRFLLTDMPVPASDKDLERILTQRLKPVYYDDPVLGRFTLDRSVNWFECEINWLGKPTRFSFDNDEDEVMADAVRTARALFADQESWNRRALAQASDDLLELKNDNWLEDDEEELTKEEFESRMELESIQVCPDGEFCFWFGDGDLFWGHSITVSGTLTEGPTEANMEG